MLKITRRRASFAMLLPVLMASGAAMAADDRWPARPITIVVPFPPGGLNDTVGRLLGQELARKLGTPVLVDNKPGVNGSLGSDYVARAAADGYTFVMTSPGTHAINQLVNSNVKYDARTSFTHVAMLATMGNVLLASPSFGFDEVQSIVEQAKARPGAINFAITGVGSSGHLSMELLKQSAGVDFNAIPYKGDAPALADLMGSQVDLLFVNAAAAMPYVQGGKVKALAVTSVDRNALLPDVPTMGQAGQPKVVINAWVGLSGPAGLPPAIVSRLNQACQEILAQPDIRERLAALGVTPTPGSAADAHAFIAAEVGKWAPVVKAGNIRAD